MDTRRKSLFLVLAGVAALIFMNTPSCSSSKPSGNENCADRMDNDGDGKIDCVDEDCSQNDICKNNPEFCADGLDNDGDGKVDCADPDCAAHTSCTEDCGNGKDDNGDALVDCADPECKGIDPRCGEVCGDGQDNDGDGKIDCLDEDCFDVIPPCGGGVGPDGTMCNYGGTAPHVCACADGQDNDGDGRPDSQDIHCFGPFDDDEGSYATGIPGDNKGAKANKECPFDGNSGTGNDWLCCNPADPAQNVTPNGCDNQGCCEIDVNGNSTGEHVYIMDSCIFAPPCGQSGKHGCACGNNGDCDAGQFCVMDNDQGSGFCSTCEPCQPVTACYNPCSCGEICYGGFSQPPEECGGGGTDGGTSDGGTAVCPQGVTECQIDSQCNAEKNERCRNGCCYQVCPEGVTPCQVSSDCPQDGYQYYCITGCCIEMPT